jgi:RNA polymerase sigma-70 factor (ECF subfamily)
MKDAIARIEESGRRWFPSTQWTDVLVARADGDEGRRREAMGRLLESYWKPVYFLVRRRGHEPDAAADLTQSFFTAFLERDYLRYVDRARGKFRFFLRTALDHHLADERDRSRALKRGGGRRHLPLDFLEAERELEGAALAQEDPERLFRRKWAVAVIKRALEALRESYAAGGRLAEYEILAARLVEPARGGATYAELAARLGVTELDVNNRLHRMRKRYRSAIWEELRLTTETDQQAEEELRELFAAFAS